MFRKSPRSQVHFVVSSPRSGSTWLQRALNGHPQVVCSEHRLYGDFAEFWPNPEGTSSLRFTLDKIASLMAGYWPAGLYSESNEELGRELHGAMVDSVVQFALRTSGKRYLIDKVTPYLGTSELVLEGLTRDFPRSQVVQLVRDGRDVAVSASFLWLRRGTEGTDRHRFFVDREPGFELQRFFDDELLTTWTKSWSEPVAAFQKLRAGAPVIRYEQMKSDLTEVLARLLDACGIRSTHQQRLSCEAQSRFEVMSGGRAAGHDNPGAMIRKGVVGDWRNYFTRRDGEMFMDIAGAQLIEMGYAEDGRWVEELPEELSMSPLGENAGR